jgi:hypothetical protein
MTTTQVEFITVNPGEVMKVGKLNRRKVRIQVMKDFRRKERQHQGLLLSTYAYEKGCTCTHSQRL